MQEQHSNRVGSYQSSEGRYRHDSPSRGRPRRDRDRPNHSRNETGTPRSIDTEQHFQFAYDTRYRPNRPRYPSGWDVQGDQDHSSFVSHYITSFTVSHDLKNISHQKSQVREQMARDIEPMAEVSDPSNAPDQIALSLLPSFVSSQIAGDTNTTSLTALHLLPSSITGLQTKPVMASALGSIKPRAYIKGFPQHLPYNILDAHIRSQLFSALQQLPGKEVPSDVTPYSMSTAIPQFILHSSAQFAFIEFASIIDAEAALSLDGMPITIPALPPHTTAQTEFWIQIRQPHDMNSYYAANPPKQYHHPNQHLFQIQGGSQAGAGGGSSDAQLLPPGSIRLYVGNILHGLDEARLKLVFSAIPGLLAFRLMQSPANPSKNFAFATYDSMDNANAAIAALNGAEFGGRALIVKLASADAAGPTVATTAPTAGSSLTMASPPPPPPPASNAHPVLVNKSHLPTEYLCFANICSVEEFQEDKDDILADFQLECQKHGTVEQLKYIIDVNNNDVIILLKFSDQFASSTALSKLANKRFGDRFVSGHFIERNIWDLAPSPA